MDVEGNGATKAALMVKVREVFHIEDFSMQTWDTGFEEWVDVEDGDIIENNSKVLINKNISCLNDSVASSSTTSSVSSGNESDKTTSE